MRVGLFGAVSSSGSGPGAPGAVVNLLASGNANGSITLTWSAPVSNGGSPITDYEVGFSSNGGGSWTTFSDGVSTSTSANVTSPPLAVGTTYTFRVRAQNAIGFGPYQTVERASEGLPSATASVGSDTTVTPTVTTTSATTQSFNVTNSVTFSSSGTWTNPFPAGASTGTATIVGTTSVGALDYVFGTTDGGPYGSTSSTGSLTGLLRNTTYYARARGINSSCAATLNGSVAANGPSTTVVFEYGTTSGVYPSSIAASQSPVSGFSSQAVSASLSSLSAGTYFYRVRATNTYGTVFSSESSVTVSAKTAFGVQRSFTPPAVTVVSSLLVVAGGGGGGSEGGGGGGGAGNLWTTASVGSSVSVTVGGGGAFGIPGANGGGSSFGLLSSSGGVGGISGDTVSGIANGGASGNGNAGGSGYYDIFANYAGGGGGGAGGAGSNSSLNDGGNGGSAATLDGYTYGGGGGGGTNVAVGGTGGTHGGNGFPNASRNGTANRGGGGGGLGNGGSGYVRFSYVGP